ncbi:MAG: dipeptide-binding ABC transporter, periplasmic substrate-binding component [Ktedonobacterales bacterium]|jgi:peptide/nickel transport system substrate-binding protein/oligopeptide transport system substrate-binding protein|nr:MAG: dipeptide-binding ABC transporter, periplasmic substrate-binding component [Ktedonobacterales bacterium]
MRLGLRKLSLPGLIVLLGTFALLVSACGSTSNSASKNLAKSQVLNMTWAGGGSTDIVTVDPGQAADSGSIPIVNMLFDGLVVLDKNLKVADWGADKVTTSTDGLTYTFHIRPGQKFSDGTPVKASDYAYAINRSDNPCLQSPVNYYLWAIKDAQTFATETCTNGTITGAVQTLIGDSLVVDDGAGTLTITLAAPAGYFLQAMTYSTSYALEQSAVTGANLGQDDKWTNNLAADTSGKATGQGGSGMFYIKTWDHQGNLKLAANPNWWGVSAGHKPYLTEVDFKIFADGDTMYNTYNSGTTYDYSDGIPAAQLAAAKSLPDYVTAPYLLVNMVAMNWNIKPFDNLDARLAFCEVINRDLLNTTVSKGANTPSWHLVPKGMPGYNPNLTGPDGLTATTGDIAKAQSHWSAYLATVGGKAAPIAYSYNVSSAASKLYAEALISGWNQNLPGANVVSDSRDWATQLAAEQQKKLQLYRSGWIADYPDPQDFLTLLYSTTSSYNDQNASLPAADQLMAQADQISDPAKQDQRMQLYNQAEQLLVNNVAICPLTQGANYYRLRTYVKGYQQDAQGSEPTTEWPNVYIQQH